MNRETENKIVFCLNVMSRHEKSDHDSPQIFFIVYKFPCIIGGKKAE